MLQTNRRGWVCALGCMVLVGELLATPPRGTVWAAPKKTTVYYYNLEVTQPGDLNVDGGYTTPDVECGPRQEPPACGWGSSFATGIRIGLPRARVCLSDALLASGEPDVILDGAECSVAESISGVMPCAVGPNFGSLAFSGSVTNAQVTYRIGETDDESGQVNRYTLQTTSGGPAVTISALNAIWPNGTGDPMNPATYTITIPVGTQWILDPDKRGSPNTTLESQAETKVTLTECIP